MAEEPLRPKARLQNFGKSENIQQMNWIAEKLACLWQQYYEVTNLGEKTCWSFAGDRGLLYKTVASRLKLAYPAKVGCPIDERKSKITFDMARDGSTTQLNLHLIREWDLGFDIVEVEKRIRKHVLSASLLFILFVSVLSYLKDFPLAVRMFLKLRFDFSNYHVWSSHIFSSLVCFTEGLSRFQFSHSPFFNLQIRYFCFYLTFPSFGR